MRSFGLFLQFFWEAFLDEAAGRWSAREALTFAGQRWSFTELQTDAVCPSLASSRPGQLHVEPFPQ